MRLVPIPLSREALEKLWPLWGPFLPAIARRQKVRISTLADQVMKHEIWLTFVWDDDTAKPVALIGTRFHYREGEMVAEMLWLTGTGHKKWAHLMPAFEELLRKAGAVECRPLCRPGWTKILKANGYKVSHIQMVKSLKE